MSPLNQLTSGASSRGYGIFSASNNINYLGIATQPISSWSQGFAIIGDASNNVYPVGNYKPSGVINKANGFVAKLNTIGNTSWQRYLESDKPSTGSDTDRIIGIGLDSSNNVYVTGFRGYNANSYLGGFIAKYDTSGSLVWQKELTRTTNNIEFFGSVTDSSGTTYIAGRYDQSTPYFVKYDSSGNVVWEKLINSHTGAGYDASLDSSGNVYFVGQFGWSGGGLAGFIIKYNSSGTEQWQRRIANNDIQANQTAILWGVSTNSSGDSYVTGTVVSPTQYDVVIAKYNTSGTLQWQRVLANSVNGFNLGYGIAIDSSDNSYITGRMTTSTNTEMFIAKYNSSGTYQWQRKITNNNGTSECIGYNTAIDSLGNFMAVGYSGVASGQTSAFYMRAPADGSLTGSYSVATQTVAYATSTTLTDGAGAMVDNAGVLTTGSPSTTASAGTLSDNAGVLSFNSRSI